MSDHKQRSDHAQKGPGVSSSTAAGGGSGLKLLKSVMFSIGSVMGNKLSGQPNAEQRGNQQQN